jgi:hypothetical protein
VRFQIVGRTLLLLAVVLACRPAMASVIGAPPIGTLSGFYPTHTYRGQTFVSPGGLGESATVYVARTMGSSVGIEFHILITETAAGNDFHPTNILFESETLVSPPGPGRELFAFTVELGHIPLEAGVRYGLIIDAYVGDNHPNQSTRTGMASNSTMGIPGPYPDGHFVEKLATVGTRAEHFAGGWYEFEDQDLAFEIVLTPIPEPGTARS